MRLRLVLSLTVALLTLVGAEVVFADTQLVFPQVVNGGQYRTSILITNRSGVNTTVRIVFTNDSGMPLIVNVPGLGTNSSFEIVIPPFGAGRLDTDGLGALAVGWASAATTPPANIDGTAVFQYSAPNNVLQAEAGVPATRATPVTDFFVDQSPGVDTGFAMANPGTITATGKLVLKALDGSQIAEVNISLGPMQHTARFIRELIPGASSGRAEITLTAGAVSAVALRYPTPSVFSAIVVGQTWGIFDRIGIGTLNPFESLQIDNGNLLLYKNDTTTRENSLMFKRFSQTTGSDPWRFGPTFSLGRLERGGDGSPNVRIFYQDDSFAQTLPPTPERKVFAFDSMGIFASIRPNIRGSHFEGFLRDGDVQPVFRLNSAPDMQLEFGPGGQALTDVIMQRTGPRALRVGAVITADGFVQSSSRQLKDNISDLSDAEALDALKALRPVKFSYKSDTQKEEHVGFIAEDVPDVVASAERNGVNTMDIVAILTKALQQQQKRLQALEQELRSQPSRASRRY